MRFNQRKNHFWLDKKENDQNENHCQNLSLHHYHHHHQLIHCKTILIINIKHQYPWWLKFFFLFHSLHLQTSICTSINNTYDYQKQNGRSIRLDTLTFWLSQFSCSFLYKVQLYKVVPLLLVSSQKFFIKAKK